MHRPFVTLFLVLWACLALPVHGYARGADMPASTLGSHDGHDTGGAHVAHGTDHTTASHPCCPGAPTGDCTHDASHTGTCAGNCAGSCGGAAKLPLALDLPLRLSSPGHGYEGLPPRAALAPAHTSLPLRPPA
ncbi:MAG: hypothetical protein CALGDGBN_01381 [Pseudomonadales bacterium]|nr:hypothetical protein [Pseudomonadales bacterium]